MEGLLSTFPPYTAYGQPVPAAPVQDSGLAKRQGRFITPQGLNYLELCKAIISQVSPDLPPPLQRAHTRECGVQVNAKVDKAVQCSLGPKTLLCLEGDHHASSGSPKSPEVACEEAGQQVSSLRFLRPVSIYSPVFDRRIHPKKVCDGGWSEGESTDTDNQAETEHSEEEEEGEDGAKEFHKTSHRASKGANFQVGLSRWTNILPSGTSAS